MSDTFTFTRRVVPMMRVATEAPQTFGGMRVYLSDDMVREDWSRCRSPSRAARRERRGHRQHVVRTPRTDALVIPTPSPGRGVPHPPPTLLMHPQAYRELREMARKNSNVDFEAREHERPQWGGGVFTERFT